MSDLLQMLDRANKGVTWGGLNAVQLEELGVMPAAEYARARRDYARWKADYRQIAQYVPHALAVAALASFALIDNWRLLSGLCLLGFGYWAAYRDGHAAGHFTGYAIGRRNTLFNLAGVSENDAATMRERAIRMEVEGTVADSLRSKRSDGT